MKTRNAVLFTLLLFLPAFPYLKRVDLNGQWEAFAGRTNDSLWKYEKNITRWLKADVPGTWRQIEGIDKEMSRVKAKSFKDLACVWYRKKFTLPRSCTGLHPVLRLFGARWKVTVWLNGKVLGEDLSGYGVLEYPCGDAVKYDGENTLVVRTGGWNSMPQTPYGLPLFPSASHPHWGGKEGAIKRGAAMEFCEHARLGKIKIDPVPGRSSAVIMTEIENLTKFHGRLSLDYIVLEKKGGKTAAKAEKQVPFSHSLKLKGGPAVYRQTVPMRGFKYWTPGAPFLYTAGIRLYLEGKLADSASVDFGMRSFRSAGGRFLLNGRPVFLRGGNLYGHSYWIGTPEQRSDPGTVKRFLVDGARAANFNCVRTHTHPMAPLWNRVADEHGLMVISEFTLIVNGSGWVLTPAERAVFRQNILAEYARIIPEVWNHPSTVMWSMTNESHWPDSGDWEAWENGPLSDWFLREDATRPLLRAANTSRHVSDNHIFVGWWRGVEGDFLDYVRDASAEARKAGLPAGISEFMQFSNYTAAKWMGPDVIPDPDNTRDWYAKPRARNFHAQLAMEYVEAMRLSGISLILPYLFPDDGTMRGREKGPFLPVFHALKNAYAPVGVSLDLFNRHYTAGREIDLKVRLVNDLPNSVKGRIAVYLTGDNPGFEPGALDASKATLLHRFKMKAPAMAGSDRKLKARLPEKPGPCFLTARLEVPGMPPVMSRRELIIYPRPEFESKRAVSQARYLGRGGPVAAWMSARKIRVLPDVQGISPDSFKVLVVGPGFLSDTVLPASVTSKITSFMEKGGNVLVMEQKRWLYPGWFNIDINRLVKGGAGAAFVKAGSPAQKILAGLDDKDLYRFNGHPGDVIRYRIAGISDSSNAWIVAQDGWKAVWESTALAEYRRGRGRALFCQLSLSGRLNKEDPANYDPVCETVLVRLISSLL